MSQTLTIETEKPLSSVRLVEGPAEGGGSSSIEAEESALLNLQKKNLTQLCGALQDAIKKLNEFQENLFREHKEQIAKLSVEIAKKVLFQKIEEGDYEIVSIIEEALKNAPTRQDVVVHLNPEDLASYQKAQESNGSGTLEDIKFIADSKIGRAECLLETPKGMIESLISEHLEQIGQALNKAE